MRDVAGGQYHKILDFQQKVASEHLKLNFRATHPEQGQTSPHAKCHRPSLLFTSLTILTSLATNKVQPFTRNLFLLSQENQLCLS